MILVIVLVTKRNDLGLCSDLHSLPEVQPCVLTHSQVGVGLELSSVAV